MNEHDLWVPWVNGNSLSCCPKGNEPMNLLGRDLPARGTLSRKDGWLVMLVAFEATLFGGGMFLFWWRFG